VTTDTNRAASLPPDQTYGDITRQLTEIPLQPARGLRWLILASLLLVGVFVASTGALLVFGVGIWGINIPVNWGLGVVNAVWPIGIAHAGTALSALLLLTGHSWRNSINRFAEAMAVAAALCASLYPILHLGRPELFYWMVPYPTAWEIWPQFRSPLVWDFFAFGAYVVVALLFWYIGLIPDLASVRDRADTPRRRAVYNALALGWRGSAAHWMRWRQAYHVIAALALGIVVLHNGGSLLFAAGPVPGWHTTLFPVFFLTGSLFAGLAVIIVLTVLLRAAYGLQNLLTLRHLELLARFLLATGLFTGYCYVMDAFFAWYSGDPYQIRTLHDRFAGAYAWSFWGAMLLSLGTIQVLWWRAARRSPAVLLAVGLLVTLGMWLERYMLLVTALYRDFLPSSWGYYFPTFWEWSLFAGVIGLFLLLFLLFLRFLPPVSIAEVKEALHEARTEAE
jgi:Ni/Fe-hydrogenase subunit HybB-like protein